MATEHAAIKHTDLNVVGYFSRVAGIIKSRVLTTMDGLDLELTRSMRLCTVRFICAIKNNGDLGHANSDAMGLLVVKRSFV